MKLEDAKKLKVGDVVCDCRYKHLKIKEIEYGFKDRRQQRHFKPYAVGLVLEDGSRCSAVHCCNAPDHEWLHPDEEELRKFYEEWGGEA